MRNREALEDAVYAAFPDLGMDDIERMETDKLQWMLEVRQGKRKDPAALTEKKQGRPRKRPSSVVWEKTGAGTRFTHSPVVRKWRRIEADTMRPS